MYPNLSRRRSATLNDFSNLFSMLPKVMQDAAVVHEMAHCIMHHTEKRILCLLFMPWKIREVCKNHEFEADRYAVMNGYGEGLKLCLRFESEGGMFHPSNAERRQKIEQYEQNSLCSRKELLADRRNR